MNQKFIKDSNSILRYIFQNEKNINILKNLIEAILNIKISQIILRKNENNKGIVETRVILENKEEINIGIQSIDGGYIQSKIFLYATQIHEKQTEYTEHSNLAKTVTINILNTEYFSTDSFHKIISFNSESKIVEDLEFHILELPKFKKTNLQNEEDFWMAYLKGDDKNLIQIAKSKNEKIKDLDDSLKEFWESEILN